MGYSGTGKVRSVNVWEFVLILESQGNFNCISQVLVTFLILDSLVYDAVYDLLLIIWDIRQGFPLKVGKFVNKIDAKQMVWR